MTTTAFAPEYRPGGPDHYDVIVVGARAAGAATAMLAARRGLRVLVLDRTTQGSDTLSTHALMRPAVSQLHRWGLLDRIVAAGTPAVRRTVFRYGSEVVPVDIQPSEGVDALYAPRRTVLDSILVDAAREAGAELRFGVTVTDLSRDRRGRVHGVVGRTHDGRRVEVAGDVTVGADGMHSRVARLVSAPTTHAANHSVATIYTYLPGIPAEGYEWYFDHQRAAGLIPTNDGETCVFVSTPPDRFRNELRRDVPAGFATVLAETAPDVAELVAASPVSPRFRAWEGMHGYLRMPYGPGWALVGDAGYFKDPITAHGITDAFRDAELLVGAIVAAAGGIADVGAYGAYEEVRDRMSLPLFHATDEVASFHWHTGGLMDTLMQVSRAMSAEGEMLAGLDATALAA